MSRMSTRTTSGRPCSVTASAALRVSTSLSAAATRSSTWTVMFCPISPPPKNQTELLWPILAEIAAGLAAAVAVDRDAGEVLARPDAIVDVTGQHLEGRRRQPVDPVEQTVVEGAPDLCELGVERAEILHHAGCRIGPAPHRHLGAKRVAVHMLGVRPQGGAGQGVGR